MATKPTKTTTTTTDPAPKPIATETVQGFDPAANARAAREEMRQATEGKEVKTSAFTILPGQSVRQGSERLMAGDTIHLSEADGERLVAQMVVEKGAGKTAKTKAAQDKADAQAQADADEAQRLADEKAAQEKAAADEAAGLLSGRENR